uniref:PSI domain-containing protein n=1 Tax=Timema shepardi TaxID=629360 RepID=A0A7R9G200_TIMSH|nr:unnamed protein product [Timema shepardi]
MVLHGNSYGINLFKIICITSQAAHSPVSVNQTMVLHGNSYVINLFKIICITSQAAHSPLSTVKLSFDFPFYGHLVRNITVATGGFLYTGEYVHSWLAATQYIAPLMANFDTSISNHSFIKYVDNGTSFTVEWEKVKLQDDTTSGDFTFQVTLHNNGDIVFVYQSVPVIIENILDRHHPVKVGLSDAYIIDRTIFFVRHKTIYEYHRVNFEKQDIKNWTVIYISALRTCLDEKNCSDCLTQFSSFKCYWCPHANRCSNGLDRLRQDWLTRGCDTSALDTSEQCPAIEEINKSVNAGHTRSPQHVIVNDRTKSGHIPGILATTIILAVCGALGLWIIIVPACGDGDAEKLVTLLPPFTCEQAVVRYAIVEK